MRTLSEIQKEFDERFGETGIYVSPSDYNEFLLEVKSFISTSLRTLLEQVVPEEVDVPEGDYGLIPHGKNVYRQQVESRIKKILNN